jgi:hypothetical protein
MRPAAGRVPADFFPAGRSAGMRIVSNTFDMGDWNPVTITKL